MDVIPQWKESKRVDAIKSESSFNRYSTINSFCICCTCCSSFETRISSTVLLLFLNRYLSRK